MAGTTLFISDLHLEPSRTDITDQFQVFMAGEARGAHALYILGDLFEMWLGDDDRTPFVGKIKSAIRGVTDAGVPVFIMHGNRDFMLGWRFCRETGAMLLDEHTVADLYGQRVLLMHGDLLCTDDVDYQKFRAKVRNPAWQRLMLAIPFRLRQMMARRMRSKAQAAAAVKSAQIMDVNQGAVEQTMANYGVDVLVHGHTHRPGVHEFTGANGIRATRIVLGDWFDQGSVLRWTEAGPALSAMPRTTAAEAPAAVPER